MSDTPEQVPANGNGKLNKQTVGAATLVALVASVPSGMVLLKDIPTRAEMQKHVAEYAPYRRDELMLQQRILTLENSQAEMRALNTVVTRLDARLESVAIELKGLREELRRSQRP